MLVHSWSAHGSVHPSSRSRALGATAPDLEKLRQYATKNIKRLDDPDDGLAVREWLTNLDAAIGFINAVTMLRSNTPEATRQSLKKAGWCIPLDTMHDDLFWSGSDGRDAIMAAQDPKHL